jgi:hypothetical protein
MSSVSSGPPPLCSPQTIFEEIGAQEALRNPTFPPSRLRGKQLNSTCPVNA